MFFKSLILLAILLLNASVSYSEESPFLLFERGKIAEARKILEISLSSAHGSGDEVKLWQALMSIAWFEDELSNYRAAIEHSNKALEVATKLNDPWRIGRSLCWLGWAYSGLGLYEMAIAFYDNAIELGAPRGEIEHVAVWGLAKQEKGAILAKLGRVEEGKTLLEDTFQYAHLNRIDVGVAEGGAHLAEIALEQGRLDEAEKYALQAVKAGERCQCSVYNTLRARTVQAKVMLARVGADAELMPPLHKYLRGLENDCRMRDQKRCIAEVKLMQSRLIPVTDFASRRELVEEAFEILSNAEHELRGVAEAELGRVYLEGQRAHLAEFYLKNGLKVEEELLRKVSAAHILSDVATLEGMNGEERAQIQTLESVIEKANSSGSLPLLLETNLKLAEKYREHRNVTRAAQYESEALAAVEELLQANKEPAEQQRLEGIRVQILESVAESGLQLKEYSYSPAHL